MARHKSIPRETGSEPQLDVSSLIDVCFLLLIYFLVTMTITPRERDLPLALPDGNPASNSPIQPIFIRLDAAGVVFTGTGNGERPIDQDADSRETPLVQIMVDPGAVQQRVIDVLNTLAAAGISRVTFTDLLEKT